MVCGEGCLKFSEESVVGSDSWWQRMPNYYLATVGISFTEKICNYMTD